MAANGRERRVRDYWQRVWSEGDTAFLHELYAPRFRLNGEVQTIQEFAAGVVSWRSHFDGFAARVDRTFASGDAVISRVVYTGSHTGDFRAVPAAGGRFQVGGIDIFEFDGDRVVDHWHETDHLELFRQLGAELGAN